ncbi:Chromatin modification-related protein [Yarrowia sp. C11]|nr:Chromatin modification-related protein [Yarrowia sp. E02]KAG5369239.1 Chromatin modification-related protein [Yarrowia sp. C11]
MVLATNSRCLAYHGPLLYEAKILMSYDPSKRGSKTKLDDGLPPTVEIGNVVNTHKRKRGPRSSLPAPGSTPDGDEANDKNRHFSPKEGKPDVPADLADENEDKICYYVHYKGWKNTWDEWVGEERVLALNEDNIKLQKELKAAALAAAKKGKDFDALAPPEALSETASPAPTTKRKSMASKDSPAEGPRPVKRRGGLAALEDLEKEDDYLKRKEIALVVPDKLKAQLVDDWEFVTKDHQLVGLPRKVTVVDILKEFKKEAEAKYRPGSADADILNEVVSGIKLYFDRSLGSILLYRFEREQYLQVTQSPDHSNKTMSDVYGAEHLLRLFVSLPGLIAMTNMDAQSVAVLKEHLEDFVRFLSTHQKTYFLKEAYTNASPAYEALSKGL